MISGTALTPHAPNYIDDDSEIDTEDTESIPEVIKDTDAILRAHGFTDRIDINSGKTATIAIFRYSGNDPDILACTINQLVIVKLPPPELNDPHDKPSLHAKLTYENEFTILSKLGLRRSNSRPPLLAKKIAGQPFIFNGPIIYCEREFLNDITKQLDLDHECERELATATLLLASLGDKSSSEAAKLKFTIISLKDQLRKSIDIKRLLVKSSFRDINQYMKELGQSPHNAVEKIERLFNSMITAINDLHKDGIIHLDIADRNFVVRSDGTAILVDYGVAREMNQANGKAICNKKFPLTSAMNSQSVLRKKHYSIDINSDFIAMQKTMLQTLCDYSGADFNELLVKGITDPALSWQAASAELENFSDKIVLENAYNNLRFYAAQLVNNKDSRGQDVLSLIQKYSSYIKREVSPRASFQEAEWENNRSFQNCSIIYGDGLRNIQEAGRPNSVTSHCSLFKTKQLTRSSSLPDAKFAINTLRAAGN